jgi:peptidoglycan/LPS O-acetylase OafA/YrhL
MTEEGGALRKMPQLDALRAFAVLAVMYQHFAPKEHWLSYVPLARFGVQLFFVLSGFLITGILLVARDRISRGESRLFELRQFYVRRFLRIFPLYYGVVIIGALIGIPGFRQPIVWHLAYSTNIYNAITGQWAGATAHLWTLSVEEQFYLCWPWIILFLSRRYLLPMMFVVVMTAPVFRLLLLAYGYSTMAVYTLTPSSLDAFAAGGLLAMARHRQEKLNDSSLRDKLTRLGLWLGLPAVVLTFGSLALPGNWSWIFTVGANLALSSIFTWLISRAADGFGGGGKRLFTGSFLLYLGKISYGLYVFHYIIAYSVSKALMEWSSLRALRPAMHSDAVRLLVLSVLTFILATASWFLYEQPILSLKRFFPYARVGFRPQTHDLQEKSKAPG